MATTTGGTTYVTSTDLVADYPTASLALANRVDVVASGGPNSIKTSGYTITLADILGGNKFLYNSASPGTFTLPTSGLVDGMVVDVAQIGAGAASVTGGTIVGTTSTSAQYQGLRLIYASTGTTWYSVAPSVTTPGLAIVSPTSIANSGGTATASGGQITVTGVSSVSLNGVFTSTYDNYRIISRFIGSTGATSNMRMRLAGTDSTTGIYGRFGGYAGAASGNTNSSAQGSWVAGDLTSSNYTVATFDITAPAIAQKTVCNSLVSDPANILGYWQLNHDTATAYDGITFYPGAGNITGTIRVYGYKNS